MSVFSKLGPHPTHPKYFKLVTFVQVFLWADKYRPRKPRFFNRVHTGYEWNKYNQTHYDFDNPPPKIVQGYKFNIFYPDLIKRDEPPTYTITPDQQSTDFAVNLVDIFACAFCTDHRKCVQLHNSR